MDPIAHMYWTNRIGTGRCGLAVTLDGHEWFLEAETENDLVGKLAELQQIITDHISK
jgi:hypothetical protein